jgi:hypothetical protein
MLGRDRARSREIGWLAAAASKTGSVDTQRRMPPITGPPAQAPEFALPGK